MNFTCCESLVRLLGVTYASSTKLPSVRGATRFPIHPRLTEVLGMSSFTRRLESGLQEFGIGANVVFGNFKLRKYPRLRGQRLIISEPSSESLQRFSWHETVFIVQASLADCTDTSPSEFQASLEIPCVHCLGALCWVNCWF